jgi:hypothetical protein
MYECHNTGTSGAIRLGIAALKPVYALKGCRQFRDLIEEYPYGCTWASSWGTLEAWLRGASTVDRSYGCNQIAVRDSWTRQATAYAIIFQQAALEAGR